MPLPYYALALILFAVLGILQHVVRAVFNVFPDRDFTSKPRNSYSFTDDILSGNYSMTDQLIGTEYDENGYYDLHSLKNLKIACIMCMAGGMLAILITPGLDHVFAAGVDHVFDWLKDLFFYRLANLTLI